MVHLDRAILYFDGTSEFNPYGPAGCGYEIVEMDDNGADGSIVVQASLFLGMGCSNSQAGYEGLIAGLRCVRDNLVVRKLYIRSDSIMTIEQVRMKRAVKSPSVAPLYDVVSKLLLELSKLDIRFTVVDHKRNRGSDNLAHRAVLDYGDNIVWHR